MAACTRLLTLAEAGKVELLLPAYCVGEALEKLGRQRVERTRLNASLDPHLKQLRRNRDYREHVDKFKEVLAKSVEEEERRFIAYRERLLRAATLIELTAAVLEAGASYESTLDFRGQDALVYASVISDLRASKPSRACFLNRNTKDFANPDVKAELKAENCALIGDFDDGLRKIDSVIGKQG